jgi:HEAT repeat protein
MGKMTKKICVDLIFVLIVFFLQGTVAHACPLCGLAVDESADESFNKPLAYLRIVYEQKGKDALPDIREALKISTNPAIIQRAANYLVDLDDRESIRQMESMLLELVKQVAFTTFGFGTPGFHSRLSVAYALRRFGPTTVGDRIWEKYDRLEWNRKSEVAYILSALKDPHLDERIITILNREEDHQLMQGALEAMIVSGSHQSLPFLRSKVKAWINKPNGTGTNPGPGEPTINYKFLRIKAETAIFFIDNRWKRAQQ